MQLKKQQERLYALVEQGVYTPEEFAKRRAALEAQHTALPKEKPPTSSPAPIDTATAYTRADAAGRNAFLRMFINRIIYSKSANALPEEFTLEIILK